MIEALADEELKTALGSYFYAFIGPKQNDRY
jgi:hypothetical protein